MNAFRERHRALLPGGSLDDLKPVSADFERALYRLCLAEAERVRGLRCRNAQADLVEQVALALAATIAAVTGGHTAGSVIVAQQVGAILPELAARRAGAVRETAAEAAETRQ